MSRHLDDARFHLRNAARSIERAASEDAITGRMSLALSQVAVIVRRASETTLAIRKTLRKDRP